MSVYRVGAIAFFTGTFLKYAIGVTVSEDGREFTFQGQTWRRIPPSGMPPTDHSVADPKGNYYRCIA